MDGASPRTTAAPFELLTLEGAQAETLWSTILNKRDGYRARSGLRPDLVARFRPGGRAAARRPRIVRNRLKVASRRERARIVELRGPGGCDAYL
jgi:DNA-3-methyladenine glycosylase I